LPTAECTGAAKADGELCVDKECIAKEHCTECDAEDETVCAGCEKGYTVESGACQKKDCPNLENCSLCDTREESTELECLQCNEGYLVDQRSASDAKGICIPTANCSGATKPDEDAVTCVDKACLGIERCTACDAENEALCITCEDGYTPEGTEDAQVCKKSPTGLSGGAIAGIVIAVIVVVAVVVFLCVWFLVCRKKKAEAVA